MTTATHNQTEQPRTDLSEEEKMDLAVNDAFCVAQQAKGVMDVLLELNLHTDKIEDEGILNTLHSVQSSLYRVADILEKIIWRPEEAVNESLPIQAS